MTSYEIYIFILCLIVFVMLTSLFSYLISQITLMQLKLIKNGLEDENIKKEYIKKQRTSSTAKWIGRVCSTFVCLFFIAAFVFSMYVNITEDKSANGIPSVKVVKSESMASKNPENSYLEDNGLDDQIQMFDIIICHHMPPEEELELYDIVVYQHNGVNVVHRIVGAEEPNDAHPNERYYILQGDAVEHPDILPVSYSQMKGIYTGQKIPFVGSFVLFMQSPAGWLCILLTVLVMIASPIMEKKLYDEMQNRLKHMGIVDKEKEDPKVLWTK